MYHFNCQLNATVIFATFSLKTWASETKKLRRHHIHFRFFSLQVYKVIIS